MKKTGLFLILLMALFSCKQDRKKLLTGKWHVVAFENNLQKLIGKWNAVQLVNPGMDSTAKLNQLYIDTIGKNNDAATNIKLYGAANMDSVRRLLQIQFDSAKKMRDYGVKTTSFYFGENGLALLSFQGNIDSSAWYVDSLGFLILDDMNDATKGEKVRMEIVSVSDTALQLKFRDNGDYSIVTFHPEGDRTTKKEPEADTWFNFRPDGIVELIVDKETDTANWNLENDSIINIRSVVKTPDGEPMRWNILAIGNDNLTLKIIENSAISKLTFKREGK